MMLGIPSTANTNNGAASAAAAEAAAAAAENSGGGDSGGGGGIQSGGFSEDDMRPDRGSGGGNRWPRQETIALLKIRQDMDNTFRDSSLKGPLWDEVSRKMADLGYHRTSKKCKEKFENVFKYHKRTKEGRASKADGKTYRFFDQLEALEGAQLPPTPTPRAPPPLAGAASQMPPTSAAGAIINHPPHITVSSAPLSPNPVSFAQNLVGNNPNSGTNLNSNPNPNPNPNPPPPPAVNAPPPPQHHHYSASVMAGMMSNSTSSSSTSSDEEIGRRHGRKRKWKDFFEQLMKDVVSKQEELHRRFLESLEKRERDRMVRDEAWRSQEQARVTREHELLVHERSMAAAKDAAVIAFIQKVTDQHNHQTPNNPNPSPPIQIPPQITIPPPQQPPPPPPQLPIITTTMPVATPAPAPPPAQPPTLLTPPPPPQLRVADMSITPKPDNNGIPSFLQPSPSRWPKSEVQALIKLRTNLDMKYQENGPKGPLWEEISAGMRKMGYNRNAKRCKEKWENINKYFKKVKESNKKRPQDSKTCPYFHQLEALYREKGTHTPTYAALPAPPATATATTAAPSMPIMARPEQQWPLILAPPPSQQQQQRQSQDSAMEEDRESDNMDENDDHDDDGDDDDDDDDEGGDYEMVTKQPQQQQQQQQGASVATSAAQ